MPTWRLSDITSGSKKDTVLYIIEITNDEDKVIYCEYWAHSQLKKGIALRCKKNCTRLILQFKEDGVLKTEKRPSDRKFKKVPKCNIGGEEKYSKLRRLQTITYTQSDVL